MNRNSSEGRIPGEIGKLSRRHWMKLGAGFGVAGLLPQTARADVYPGNPLRLPSDWDGSSPLTIDEAALEVWPGQTTPVLAINGGVPGPTIRMRRGETFNAEVRNQLNGENVILHWHGLLSPAQYDGHPSQAVAPGGSYTVSIPIIQQPSMCWYHSHTHDATGSQVYRGLAGLFFIEDPERDAALGLPTGDRDVPLAIRDWLSNGSYQLNYSPSMFQNMWGYLGDTALVNGTPEAWLAVDQGVWRFRVLNACNARVLRLGFSDGKSMRVVGSDGGLTGSQEVVTQLDLGPGQRAEILVSFAGLAVGSSTVLRSLEFPRTPPMGPAGPRQGDPLDLMTFHVDTAGGAAGLPGSLPQPEFPDPAEATRTRTFALGRFMGVHTINGLTYDLNRTDFQVPCGEVEIWEFQNQTPDYHPMHSHGAFFQVLTRNGVTAALPTDKGWRDTVLVYPNETVRIAVAFGSRPGTFLMHCHNLEHERQMMQNFEVLVPEAPPLAIDQDGDEMVLSWPAPSTGWKLHASGDLVNWDILDITPVVVDGRNEWRVTPDHPREFYRLMKP